MTTSLTRQKRTIGASYACHACGAMFVAKTTWQDFCSTLCRLSSYGSRPHTCRCGRVHRPRKPQPQKARVRHEREPARCRETCWCQSEGGRHG
jgi:hypothetical protein